MATRHQAEVPMFAGLTCQAPHAPAAEEGEPIHEIKNVNTQIWEPESQSKIPDCKGLFRKATDRAQ